MAAIWVGATDRREISAASNEIDRLLSRDADTVGEHSFDTVRTLNVLPLGVEFEVSTADRLVAVLAVWDLDNPPA